jgi:glycosyltransferase involved in cell wall biosynthesis
MDGLRILAPSFYGMGFVTPRESRHEIVRCPYSAPWRRLWRPLDAIAFGLPERDCHVIHSYNRIPLTRKPWVVASESWFPRTLTQRDFGLRRALLRRLARENCKRVLPLSDYARNVFTLFNEGMPELAAVLAKTEIVYPNVPLRADRPKTFAEGPLKVLFVGNDFAQKGGVAAVRLAGSAKTTGLPIEVHIVSALRYGKSVFADCPKPGVYDKDVELLKLDNVVLHGTQPNDRVIELMKECHFLLLTSLDDTFGFSVIEAMSVGTPAIVSNVCALPELVRSGDNGAVIELPLDRYRKWTQLKLRQWPVLNEAYDLFAANALEFLTALSSEPSRYEALSAGAIGQIREHHDAVKVGARLDAIYEEAAA